MRAVLSKLVLLLDLVTRVKFLFPHHLSEKKEREKDIMRDQDFLVQASVTCAQMTTETLTVNVKAKKIKDLF